MEKDIGDLCHGKMLKEPKRRHYVPWLQCIVLSLPVMSRDLGMVQVNV